MEKKTRELLIGICIAITSVLAIVVTIYSLITEKFWIIYLLLAFALAFMIYNKRKRVPIPRSDILFVASIIIIGLLSLTLALIPLKNGWALLFSIIALIVVIGISLISLWAWIRTLRLFFRGKGK